MPGREPISHLRLWSGQEDVTSMFTIDEYDPDHWRLNGPFELLTHYTVNENLKAYCRIDGRSLADTARRAEAAGDYFHARMPNYYHRY